MVFVFTKLPDFLNRCKLKKQNAEKNFIVKILNKDKKYFRFLYTIEQNLTILNDIVRTVIKKHF